MTINKTLENGNVVFALNGKMDTWSAPELQEILIPAFDEVGSDGSVVLDFAKLSYISSAGLRVLFFGEKTAKEKNIPMKIINVSIEIKEILIMTGFMDILKVE